MDMGFFSFQVFRTLHHANAPVLLGTFTWTWGLVFSGFLHTTSSRCSSFSWDIYMDMGVVFLWVFRTLHHADALDFLWTFTWTPGLFFGGFPHSTETCTSFLPVCDIFVYDTYPWNYLSTSCRCSGFSQDIYLDTRVVFFSGFSHISGTSTASLHIVSLFYFEYLAMRLCVYILQMLWKFCIFAGHLPGHHGCFLFWFSTHPQNMYCIFTCVWHIYCLCTSCRCTRNFAFSWEIYLDNRVVFFGRFLCIPKTCIKWCPTNSQ